jgi:hypothetical protein
MWSNSATFWDRVTRLVEDRAALEQDVAGIRHVKTRQAVEECGLAGAVGADQAGDPARRHVERHAVEGNDAAETHRHVAHAQLRVRGALLRQRARISLSHHG